MNTVHATFNSFQMASNSAIFAQINQNGNRTFPCSKKVLISIARSISAANTLASEPRVHRHKD